MYRGTFFYFLIRNETSVDAKFEKQPEKSKKKDFIYHPVGVLIRNISL